jgi:uncharacterized lipoprotein YbaY
MRSSKRAALGWLAVAACAAGCAGSGKTTATNEDSAKLTGTVTYLQRVALPASAVCHLRLEDVSRADAPATTIAVVSIPSEGRNVPLPFELPYDPARIDPNHMYAVRANLDFGDGRVWRTTQGYRVLTGGNPSNLEIVVEP